MMNHQKNYERLCRGLRLIHQTHPALVVKIGSHPQQDQGLGYFLGREGSMVCVGTTPEEVLAVAAEAVEAKAN